MAFQRGGFIYQLKVEIAVIYKAVLFDQHIFKIIAHSRYCRHATDTASLKEIFAHDVMTAYAVMNKVVADKAEVKSYRVNVREATGFDYVVMSAV